MAIGIYFDDKGAVAVRVEGSAKKARIAACAELEWEAPSPEADADARKEARKDQLKTWLKKNKLLGQPVALCLDSSHVLFRDMHMAFGDRRQIDKVITFQVEGLIPSTPIEELAVGYTILDSNEEGSQLLVSAAHKGPLREQIELLDSVKTSAELADSTIGGALNLRPFIPELAHVEEPTAWVDVQGGRAMIAVLVDDKIKSVRNLLIPLPAVRELAAAREDGADDEGSAKTATGDSTDTADFEDIKDSTAEQPFSDELVDEDAPEDKASDDIDFDDDNDEQVGEVTDAVVVLDHGDSGRLPQIKAAEPLDDSRGSEPSFTAPLVATESSHDMLSGDSTSEPPAASDASFIGAPNEPTLFAPKVQSTAGRQSPAEALAKLLTLELRRAIVGSQAGAIKRVVLTGVPQSLHEHLKGLKRDLEIRELVFADLLAGLVGRDRKGKAKVEIPSSPVVASVAGVALKKISGADQSGVDFLIGDLAPGDVFEEARAPLAIGSTLLFLIAGVMLLVVIKERGHLLDYRESASKTYKIEQEFNAAYKLASDKEKRKFPGGETATERIVAAEKLLSTDVGTANTQNKSKYPPTFEADDVYKQFLDVIHLVVGNNGNPNDFALLNWNYNQSVRGNKTGGTLTFECILEVTEYVKLKRALEELQIPNPIFDNKEYPQKDVKAFERVVYEEIKDSRFIRGERKPKSGTTPEKIWVAKFKFTCDINPLERKKEVAKKTSTGKT